MQLLFNHIWISIPILFIFAIAAIFVFSRELDKYIIVDEPDDMEDHCEHCEEFDICWNNSKHMMNCTKGMPQDLIEQ